MNDLKLCPFCGTKSMIWSAFDNVMKCTFCGVETVATICFESSEEVTEAWNRRASDE